MKKAVTEAKLLLIGIPVAIWTLLPIYNMFVFSISTKNEAFSGKLWPDHPTLRNFEIVFREEHHFLGFFWRQLGNSLVIAIAVYVLVHVGFALHTIDEEEAARTLELLEEIEW